jgi:FkbM family methyltransferase
MGKGDQEMSKSIKINGVWPITLPESSADEWLGNMKYHHNSWEQPRLLELEKAIRLINDTGRKPIVMYIGAYKGDMAALLASWGADLILMESTAAFWPLIKETWELNKLPEPVGFFSGLLGRESNQEFNKEYLTKWPERTAEYIEGAVGFTHLAESHDDPTFPRITIDDFIAVTGITPDIITMDVEGSELEICYGGVNTIINDCPMFMISVHPEFMFHNHGTYERELHDLLRNNKYTGTWIDYDHEHHWLYERSII